MTAEEEPSSCAHARMLPSDVIHRIAVLGPLRDVCPVYTFDDAADDAVAAAAAFGADTDADAQAVRRAVFASRQHTRVPRHGVPAGYDEHEAWTLLGVRVWAARVQTRQRDWVGLVGVVGGVTTKTR